MVREGTRGERKERGHGEKGGPHGVRMMSERASKRTSERRRRIARRRHRKDVRMCGSSPCAARRSARRRRVEEGGASRFGEKAFHGSGFRQKEVPDRKGTFGGKGAFGTSGTFNPRPLQMLQRLPKPDSIAAAHARRGTIKRMQLLCPRIKGTDTGSLPVLARTHPHAVRTPDRAGAARTNATRAARAPERRDSEKRTSAELVLARSAPTGYASAERTSMGLAIAERVSERSASAKIASAEPASAKSVAAERASAGRISAEHALAKRTSAELAFAERTLARNAPTGCAPTERTSSKRPKSAADAAAPRRDVAERR